MSVDSGNDGLFGFARSIDECGRRHWRTHGPEIKQGARRSGYIASIIVNIVMAIIFNNLLAWHVPFLTQEFAIPLVIFNISFIAQIVANLFFLFYDASWFRHLARIALNVIGFLSLYLLWVVFPFDLPTEMIVTIVKIALAVGMVGTAIGTIVEFFKLAFGRE